MRQLCALLGWKEDLEALIADSQQHFKAAHSGSGDAAAAEVEGGAEGDVAAAEPVEAAAPPGPPAPEDGAAAGGPAES